MCLQSKSLVNRYMVFPESLVGQTGVTGRLVGQTMVTGQFHLSCRDSNYAETEVKEAVRMRNCSTILRAAWYCRVYLGARISKLQFVISGATLELDNTGESRVL